METQTSEKPNLLAGYVPDKEFCRQMEITPRTSRKWRQTGEGPPYANVGGAIYYPVAEFQKWLQKRVRTTCGR